MTTRSTPPPVPKILRPPAEVEFADELAILAARDGGDRPAGWKLSPASVLEFVCGSRDRKIRRKFHGNDPLVQNAIVSLAGGRGLMLVGEPGTAKSWLSELLAAAISGVSTNLVQGSAGTSEEQIRYGWNYALLLAEGPSERALVPGPVAVGMKEGILVRFEELTRCAPEIQDVMIGILSEKMLAIPELPGEGRTLFARPGFGVIATANTRDRGVHEMSSTLKRRLDFVAVPPIARLSDEIELVRIETARQLVAVGTPARIDATLLEHLVQVFHELRSGRTVEGTPVERPAAVLSTAEAVATASLVALEAHWFGRAGEASRFAPPHLAAAIAKDEPKDLEKLVRYLEVVSKARPGDELWSRWKSDLSKKRRS
jgi:MoxR-like ATPase